MAYSRFAEIYDSLINEDIDYLTWSDFIREKCLELNIRTDDYLDLGCGTGNLSINLSRGFKRTWCVDLSEEMLIIAESKFRDKGIKAKFVNQDMRYLKLNNRFDLITCALDSTNYLTEDRDLDIFFLGVATHLKEKGLFIFDINSEYKLEKILGDNIFTYNSDEIVYLWENTLDNRIVEMYLTFFISEGKLYERFDEVHRERIYSTEEIEQALKQNGLNIVAKVDNYTNNPVKADSERITYIVVKG
ncbi:class I SAM-dependent DNA methyltransferase [Clostridium thermarum]|uniref:class I SAM-dependent DNA methyltransferase n=1 Tax=Clostridium thermarum TaxID=1716543 RepID=UPI0013D58BD2|nr:class I SAM-dependent methyltransferase [Clostridium thermarum]